MPQRRHLPNDARLRAIGMLEAGMRQVEVARRLGVSQSVISRLRTRLAQTNSTLDRRRSGRPNVSQELEQVCLFKPFGIDFTALDLELRDLTLGCHFPRQKKTSQASMDKAASSMD